MLVVTRKANESIVINGNITVTVANIDGKKVRIGIQAPPDVKILRSELTDRRAAATPSAPRVKSYRILVIEDDEVDREVIRRCLSSDREQYSLSESGLGQEGLDRCQQEKPDCVLLDYRLPDITGLQFLDILRQSGIGDRIPVIMITGDKGEQIQTESIARGAQRFLAKRDLSSEKLRAEIFQAMHSISPN